MKNKVFIFILVAFMVFFGLLLFAQSNGYYQSKNIKAKVLTERQIKEFEQDIEDGKKIDLKKYVLYEEKDYTNDITDKFYKISLKLEGFMDKTIKLVFNKTGKLVSD